MTSSALNPLINLLDTHRIHNPSLRAHQAKGPNQLSDGTPSLGRVLHIVLVHASFRRYTYGDEGIIA